ncbi:regulator of G protein signaling superfamily [Aspergillus taichungensis]|uniref:Regulator of G protein signaling superfamily n=1 Tax=Aspergillus taichungensis TaxID=482145 RepID=A0A2J5I389_9EURO|nr:regulator of G protein signaling superfamily [Aspergillus taichungensis]
MLRKKALHPPLLFWNHTPTSTPELSPTTSSSDSDSDGDMDPAHSRPLSLAATPGVFGPMRPTLDEVLANSAPAPYTLSAFMAYLSQNHCLETLEFTLEAKRYREAYAELSHPLLPSPVPADSPQCQRVRMLWKRLLTAYILPGAPREINVSSEVREHILRHAHCPFPPAPDVLDTATRLVHDLMEESIFLPFLNAHAASTPLLSPQEPCCTVEERVSVVSGSGFDEHAVRRVRSKSKARRLSPQSSRDLGANFAHSFPAGTGSRSNFSLSAMTAMTKATHRTSGPVSSASGDSVSATLTDDSGSFGSHTSVGEPMTPPTTPPSSEPNMQLMHSPKNRTDNPWKKMGMKLGFKKRSGNGSSGSMKMAGLEE